MFNVCAWRRGGIHSTARQGKKRKSNPVMTKKNMKKSGKIFLIFLEGGNDSAVSMFPYKTVAEIFFRIMVDF